MAPKAKEPKKVQIRKLPPHAIFNFVNHKGETETWKVEGRPTQIATGREDGRREYVVFCVYQKANKNDQNPGGAKLFNVDFEVEFVENGSKSFDALDRRNQPDTIEPIDRIAKQHEVDWDKDIQSLEDDMEDEDD